jgi:hypothetical protein
VKSIILATGGRIAQQRVYDHLDYAYQDSGLLGSLMSGTLDAPDYMPAGAVQADDHFRCGAMQLAARPGVAA